MSQSLCLSIIDSARSRSFSLRTNSVWWTTNRSRFSCSRFPILNRFAWLLRFSRCLCLRMRDRRADSRFDIMRLRFRSSRTEPDRLVFNLFRFECSGPGFSSFWSGSWEPLLWDGFWVSEPELDVTGSGVKKGEWTG